MAGIRPCSPHHHIIIESCVVGLEAFQLRGAYLCASVQPRCSTFRSIVDLTLKQVPLVFHNKCDQNVSVIFSFFFFFRFFYSPATHSQRMRWRHLNVRIHYAHLGGPYTTKSMTFQLVSNYRPNETT